MDSFMDRRYNHADRMYERWGQSHEEMISLAPRPSPFAYTIEQEENVPVYEVREIVEGEVVSIKIEMDAVAVAKSPFENLRGPQESARKVVEAARDVFGEGVELARNCALRVVHGMRQMDEKTLPDELEVQFAIKLDSEVGAILAKMGTEAQLQVTMRWNREKFS